MKETLLVVLPIIVFLVCLVSISLWVILKSETLTALKVLLVPAVISLAIFAGVSVISLLGHAVPERPSERVAVLAHRAVVENGVKKKLELWVISNGTSRLHVLPYTKKLEEALEKGQQARRQGYQSELEIEHDVVQMHLVVPKMPLKPDETQ